jgi:hypothetical protein
MRSDVFQLLDPCVQAEFVLQVGAGGHHLGHLVLQGVEFLAFDAGDLGVRLLGQGGLHGLVLGHVLALRAQVIDGEQQVGQKRAGLGAFRGDGLRSSGRRGPADGDAVDRTAIWVWAASAVRAACRRRRCRRRRHAQLPAGVRAFALAHDQRSAR